MSVGTRIKERREELCISQIHLAALLNITKGAVCNYEKGLSVPKASNLFRLFEVLQCDANYLFQDYMPNK